MELYIKPKYSNLKDEILNNNKYALNTQLYLQSVTKAQTYINTEKIRNMKVQQLFGHGQDDPLKYELYNQDQMTIQHVMSLILYTDYDNLSTAFSKTFRKISPQQTIDDVKRNNQEFAIWSRLLRETIEYFGFNQFGDEYVTEFFARNELYGYGYPRRISNSLFGPFYCGMSVKMVVPQFHMNLYGPTSTSFDKEIAVKFSGQKGILLKLNNTGTENSAYLRGMNVEWISRFTEEREVIWIGGEFEIRIENIITIEDRKSYKSYFEIMFIFEALINGLMLIDDFSKKVNYVYYDTIQSLINHYLGIDGYKNDCDEYVNTTFAAFIKQRKQITFKMYQSDINLKAISWILLNNLIQTKIYHSPVCNMGIDECLSSRSYPSKIHYYCCCKGITHRSW